MFGHKNPNKFCVRFLKRENYVKKKYLKKTLKTKFTIFARILFVALIKSKISLFNIANYKVQYIFFSAHFKFLR
jgi:hypothetical protein